MNTKVILLGALLTAGTAAAQAKECKIEKPTVELAVGGKSALYYLPLTVAERLGYLKEEGLNVKINDFAGGSKALQALIGGSVDVTAGAFDHVVQMQAQGRDVVGLVSLGQYPGIVLAVNARKADKIKSIKDLKGAKVGVSAPGSSTNFMVNYLLTKNGLKPEDVSIIAVGTGSSAIAAVKRGEIDVLSGLDPAITTLENDGAIKILADTRTQRGTLNVYDGPYPAATIYTQAEFLKKNPCTAQALANAFVRTLRWMEKATPEQIAAVLPEEYFLGDKGLYMNAMKQSLNLYSKTGIVTKAGAETAYNVLSKFDPNVKPGSVNLKNTFDARFVSKAAQKYK